MGNKITVPCNVSITRFYRAYAEVCEDASDEEIRKAIIQQIIEDQDNALVADQDLEIEEDDIASIEIDHDGIFESL